MTKTVLNFRPISVLNYFSRVYENILKTQLVEKMSNIFPPFVSAYRKSYNTQHVFIGLIVEWTKNLDNSYFIETVLTDLSKAFDCIAHDLVIAKLAAYGFDKKNDMLHLLILKSTKQCFSVNNIKILSMSYLISFNNFFYFILVIRLIILKMTILFQVLLKQQRI